MLRYNKEDVGGTDDCDMWDAYIECSSNDIDIQQVDCDNINLIACDYFEWGWKAAMKFVKEQNE